jgi:hypothetical protein
MKHSLCKYFLILFLLFFAWISCVSEEDTQEYTGGDLKITIEEGEHWLHDFPLFLGIKVKNPPQFAVWIEDMDGHYLTTIFATKRIATQGWRASKGNRRKEALPHWSYSRGVQYPDGLYLPTKEDPLPDAVTGATPKSGIELKFSPIENRQKFIIKAEFNHSVDCNDYFPEDVPGREKDMNGQPAVIYSALIDLSYEKNIYEMNLVGCSSPDGNDGDIHSGLLSKLTTAKTIVSRISVVIHH